ncbi:MAG TPA: glycosyltransferase [Terracidiphilus sp.]|nr:glycosyltransferase [Terracidiphilus sp.]
MRRLTILTVAYPLACLGSDAVGGAEQIATALDRALVENGWRSVVVAHAESRTLGSLIGTPVPGGVISPEVRDNVERSHQVSIDRALATFPVDLVHMHDFYFHRYRIPSHLPVLVTLHLPPSWYPESIWNLPVNIHLQGVSQTQRNMCPAEVRDRMPVVENGVGIPAADRLRKGRFALMLSRICPEKNLHAGLDAAALAKFPVLLAGRVFPYQEHLRYFEEEIRPRLHRARGRLLGGVGVDQKYRLLSRAACLLLPSIAPETSSLVAMEAAAAGTPVVAFPSGAVPEVVENGRTGFLVNSTEEMADAIRRVPDIDPAVCRSVAEARFPLQRMIESYFNLYRVLSEGNRISTQRFEASLSSRRVL